MKKTIYIVSAIFMLAIGAAVITKPSDAFIKAQFNEYYRNMDTMLLKQAIFNMYLVDSDIEADKKGLSIEDKLLYKEVWMTLENQSQQIGTAYLSGFHYSGWENIVLKDIRGSNALKIEAMKIKYANNPEMLKYFTEDTH